MKANLALRLLPFLLLPACLGAGPTRAPDEIADRDVWLPEGAREGMFIRWRVTAGPIVEKEIACVAGPQGTRTIEWRKAGADGTTTVTAARFAEDGTTLGAWLGPSGGVGQELRIVPHDAEAAMQRAEAMGREHGVAADAASEMDTETVETAAGRIACRRRRITASVLFLSGTMTSWWALDPLPLSQLVRFHVDMTGWQEQQELVAYGWTGAVPTLQIPEG